MPRHIAILGSTGSIGTQALEVISAHPDKFVVEVLTAQRNADLLIQQARKFQPNVVVIGDEKLYDHVKESLSTEPIKVYAGENALAEVVTMDSIHIVLTALVGYAGLLPTLAAIASGKHIALANKETLVVAGDLVSRAARENRVDILPVDSEHSAIFQCLAGEFEQKIEKIILTASGGPFRGKKREELIHVTKNQALKHPNWAMGAKISIDSASMMNKGLEVIEAKWLFDLTPEEIEVIVHPQSIIHSMVQFEDGSIKAQMGLPDMKLPIQYALAYPNRIPLNAPRFSFAQYPTLTFEEPDLETFRNLAFAYDALRKGGNMACILNAANEVVVDAFLKDQVSFLGMSDILEKSMSALPFIQNPSLEDYIQTDQETRQFVQNLL